MRVKMLRKVQKHIQEEPKRLYMADWIFNGTPEAQLPSLENRTVPKCGTAACIAGWVTILSKHESATASFIFSFAQEALGLNDVKTERLFYVSKWPKRFKNKYIDDGSEKSAKIAVRRIEHFIATNGAE